MCHTYSHQQPRCPPERAARRRLLNLCLGGVRNCVSGAAFPCLLSFPASSSCHLLSSPFFSCVLAVAAGRFCCGPRMACPASGSYFKTRPLEATAALASSVPHLRHIPTADGSSNNSPLRQTAGEVGAAVGAVACNTCGSTCSSTGSHPHLRTPSRGLLHMLAQLQDSATAALSSAVNIHGRLQVRCWN